MKKITIFLFYITISILDTPVFSRIETKQDAREFLNEYCIEIVVNIKESYERQIKAVNLSDWESFGKEGQWIGGLSDIYSKLCK